ncbi:MAG: hypothetical protein V4440_08615 [Pseudomonadota bacterium]
MAIPASPSNFALQQGDGQTLSSWDIVTGATSYSVQRSTDGVAFTEIATPVVNSYLDTSVTVNTLYYYQIASVNSDGTSAYTTAQQIIPTLSNVISLGELRQRSKEAADRTNSNFLTLPEWNFNINQSARELYDLLITVYEDYFVAPRLSFQTDGTSYQYILPNGANYSSAPAFYKLFGVDLGLDSSSNAWITLKKFDFIQRNSYVYPQITSSFLGVFNLQYRLVGNYIHFIPIPSSGQPVGLWYFPRLPTLLQDTDHFDQISGWAEYIIVDAAIKALRKEESDTQVLMAQKQALIKRINDSAVNRDAGQPDKISDTRRYASGGWNDTGAGGNGGGSWGGY